MIDRHQLGERPPMAETRGETSVTDVQVTGSARRAETTTDREGDGHPFPTAPSVDLRPNLPNHTGHLVPGHMRERRQVLMTLPRVPVTQTDARRLDRKHNPRWRCHRVGILGDDQGLFVGGDRGGTHGSEIRQGPMLVLI
jgi:hypothetical protein